MRVSVDELKNVPVGFTVELEGVFSVNPMTRKSTGFPMQVTRTGEHSFMPALIPDGEYKNCCFGESEVPKNG